MADEILVDAEAELLAELERCHQAISDPAPPAPPPGSRGVIGHFPVYFPEEIPHAAGLLPVNVLGGGNRLEIRLADARLGSFVCSIYRSTTELGLNGTFKDLKGFVTHPICDAAKHLAGIWARNSRSSRRRSSTCRKTSAPPARRATSPTSTAGCSPVSSAGSARS